MIKVLFVCLGNICRSPTAEAIFRHKVEQAGLGDQVLIDSAGTGDWHIGKAPDPRTQQAALKRGYNLSALRGRQVRAEDLARFDWVLAMDGDNLANLKRLKRADSTATVDLFLRRFDMPVNDVPDPYYGGPEGFEQVLDLLEQACDALLAEVKKSL